MSEHIRPALEQLAADGNLDTEDLAALLALAREDGLVTGLELDVLESGIHVFGTAFEPAARDYLDAVLSGADPTLPNRILLAPHPSGKTPDRYYPRSEAVALQEALNHLGSALGVDGYYGPMTATAVGAFQESQGLANTGSVDSATLVRLNGALGDGGFPLIDLTPRARVRPDHVVAMKHSEDRVLNTSIAQALVALADHFGVDDLRAPIDGVFGDALEAAVSAFQRRVYLPGTGIVDGTTLRALNLALDALDLPRVEASGTPLTPHADLHFYPGDAERKVYVIASDGEVLDVYGMVGGRRQAVVDPTHPYQDYNPTPRGSYDIVEVNPHVSYAWPFSYVPYGSQLRDVDGEIQYRDGAGTWKWATGPDSVFSSRNPPALAAGSYYDADGRLPPTWTKNDFGHLRARLRNRATGNLQGHMIHSSPSVETTERYFQPTDGLLEPDIALSELDHSHGCEHIHPRDVDEMVAKRYLAPGVHFVVHGYDETFESPAIT